MTNEEKLKTYHQRLVEFENKIKEIGIEIGGFAVIRSIDKHFHLIEHPTENRFLIDKNFFYSHKKDTVDNCEIIYKYKP